MTANESQTYQAMLEEVEKIAASITGNASSVDLDALVTKIDRGYDLIKEMRKRLDTTKMRVEEIRGN